MNFFFFGFLKLTIIFSFFTFIRWRKQSTLFVIIVITEITFTCSIICQVNSLSSIFCYVITRSMSQICTENQNGPLNSIKCYYNALSPYNYNLTYALTMNRYPIMFINPVHCNRAIMLFLRENPSIAFVGM